MYCCLSLGVREHDAVLVFDDETGKTWKMNHSQLRSYNWIAGAIKSYIKEKKLSKEDNMKSLSLSSRFDAIYQAITNGSKLENLSFSELLFEANKEYIVY